ncbi:unnamed protein product [Allacma fusca]|uniref:Guanylate-binding protein N-terminal domain-containing protein n=1 Tax=Allacma fusca TaxID=39272 RepID=A0A8J2NID1_9HEXA|nr:unnamed protein product [Allacma fusca]
MLTYIVRYLQVLVQAEDGSVGDWMTKNKPNQSKKEDRFFFPNGVATNGIWMWTTPFIIRRSKTESPIAVLVVVTDACFDLNANEQKHFPIIGLILLLSSFFIYNDTKVISETSISTLTQFMHYGQVASQSFEGKAFQRLMFLIRNCNVAGLNHASRNYKLVQDNFEDCKAYLMSEDFIGLDGGITAEFQDPFKAFVVNLVADVVPKRFGSIPASWGTFCYTIKNLVAAFNAEDMHSPTSKLDSVLRIVLNLPEKQHVKKQPHRPQPILNMDLETSGK